MSNVEPDPQESTCRSEPSPASRLLAGREVVIGTRGLPVIRMLPDRRRSLIGAWCFLDHFGPHQSGPHQSGPNPRDGGPGMRIAPHPHTGLQTVTWLLDGAVRHRDSLGSDQVIRPGQLNLMTAGHAIAHAEESTPDAPRVLHGVQLWVALPEQHRHRSGQFEHHATLPELAGHGFTATVMIGELDGAASPATSYTPLLGAQLTVTSQARIPLRPEFEYGIITLTGAAQVDGVELRPGTLLYLGTGRTELSLDTTAPARLLLLGGLPFEEEIVMWWNFVGRGHDEIVQQREDWMTGDRFGVVAGYGAERLPAPPMPNARLRPRGGGR